MSIPFYGKFDEKLFNYFHWIQIGKPMALVLLEYMDLPDTFYGMQIYNYHRYLKSILFLKKDRINQSLQWLICYFHSFALISTK